ncbi:LysM peptidoglycan-binding domain-containing protein [Sporolactobacillus sp. THM7-7]|nr:LysM peptidoglycan-binding domain-containing protein [Sporolactobacillus sp. THM7-7]
MGKYHIRRRRGLKRIISIASAFVLALSFALPASAAGQIDFLDVSHYQSESGLPLSVYQTAKRGNINGVVVKVSESNGYRDPAAAVNIANARAAGLRVSAYHYARTTSVSDARSEARWFDKSLQAAGFNKKSDGYAVIDIEDPNLTHNRSALTSYVNAFLDEMNKLGYARTDIYSGAYYYGNRLIPSQLNNSRPWLARYSTSGSSVLDPGYNRGAHQWSSSQRPFPGYGNFDVNIDYSGKYTGSASKEVGKVGSVSLVNYLKSKKINASFANRTKLAVKYGIVIKSSDYHGTAAQNIALLTKLRTGAKPAEQPKAETKKPSSESSTYTVRSGDTLWDISRDHGTTVSVIKSLNGLRSDLIFPGQRLKLSGSKSAAKSSSSGTYTVRRGDTLGGIAQRHHTTVSSLARLNHISNPNKIFVGQRIKLSGTASVSSRSYTVRRGDTLWEIARSKGTTVGKLKSKNNLRSDLIFPGQKLKY